MRGRNPWLRRAMDMNPYDWNGFRVLRMAPSVRGGQALRLRAVEMRNLLRACPEEVQVGGVQVTEAHLQQAAELLGDPAEHFAEELLAHQEESYQTPMLAGVVERIRAARPVAAGLQPAYVAMVRAWLEAQAQAPSRPEPIDDRRLARIAKDAPGWCSGKADARG